MAGPRGSLASHGTAAALHGMPGFERHGTIEILIPRTSRNRDMTITIHRTSIPAEAVTVEDVPCTTVARTLHSLAGLGDAAACARAVRAVLRRGELSPDGMLDHRLCHVPVAASWRAPSRSKRGGCTLESSRRSRRPGSIASSAGTCRRS